ncbi:low-temperature-induced 65 kDa protein isoform X2 [Benincasa hispida]|uniref:low-temperature-induced 65 kDa protein isoform X2 n=1 Tax=Benincasa hispida TaxID=102211 RepID=UPI0018FFBBF1|nr:low-temperature-induced 65 kDa protein isoform X2 [Benincasa hispida]
MDSQIAPHHHLHHPLALHQSVEGKEEEDGQLHEKKSVLKKVKAKAKKIKDTITKHGHGHDHDHHDYEDEDDEDEDDEVIEDPEIQGAPCAAMRSAVAGQGQHQDVGIGMTTGMHNEPSRGPRETTSRPSAFDTGFTSVDNPTTNKGADKVEDSAVAPNTTMSLSPWKLEEDPHGPHTPHNSQVKVHDPANRGSEEAGKSQVFDSFAKMKVNDEYEPNRPSLASRIDRGGEDQTNYGQKVSAVGSAVSEKAVAAKDFVASKLGYVETTEETINNSSSPLEYGKKIALTVTEKLKPGEEDKALSEVISEALSRRKYELVKVGESAFGRHQSLLSKGEVTESEELTRRLGKEDKEATEKSSVAGATAATGRSVVGMVKDTVGSWLGKAGEQSAPSQQSLGISQGVEGFVDSSSVGEGRRRQQEHAGTEPDVRILQDSAN